MTTPLRILLSGATGFVGRSLLPVLVNKGFDVTVAVRNLSKWNSSAGAGGHGSLRALEIGDIDGAVNWYPALQDVDVVIHLANRAHIMKDDSRDPVSEYFRINYEGTKALAEQSESCGVKRFVFLSTIKVNGEMTAAGEAFDEKDIVVPADPYSQSKYKAEQVLRAIAKTGQMDVVIIRPPLVYGPGVKANFQVMMKWLSAGIPLPFGSINNARSLISVDNLVDFIVTCIDHQSAGNETFVVSDDEDLSTTELLRRMGEALSRPARLFAVPDKLLKIMFHIVGRSGLYCRLCQSLQLDSAKAKSLLGWMPPVSVDDALRRTAVHYIKER